ncbi:MAG: transposase, partial [Symploca sp. SIO2E9]|nr:transposase [Symploca sp. SIO2E9]
MKARYRYRVYPTPSQQLALAKLFGCVRTVWNDALAFCLSIYQSGGTKPKNSDLQKQFITQAKKRLDRQWLKEVSNIALQQSLNDLEQAYQNFFKSCKGQRRGKPIRPPRFKKRRAKQTARFRQGGFKVAQRLKLAKIGAVKVTWSRKLPTEPTSVTIIKDSAGRYFASFVVEIEPEALPQADNSVGIDLGINTFAALDTGEKIEAPKPLKKRLRRLRKLNRNLARKTRFSNRYE